VLRLHKNDGPVAQTLAAPRPQLLAPYDVQFAELITIPRRWVSHAGADYEAEGFRSDRKYPVIMYVYGGASSASVANGWQGDTCGARLLLEADIWSSKLTTELRRDQQTTGEPDRRSCRRS
jgi:hypothetical protein